MTQGMIMTLCSAGVLALIFIYLIFRLKRSGDQSQEQVDSFLRSIRSVVEEAILKYIKEIDITNFINISDAQIDILNQLFDKMWELVILEVQKITDPVVAAIVKKTLTRGNVESFVQSIFLTPKVQSSFTEHYNEAVLVANNQALAKESQLLEYISKFEKDKTDSIPLDESITPMDYPMTNAEIIPPREEESEVIDVDDDSIEIIE